MRLWLSSFCAHIARLLNTPANRSAFPGGFFPLPFVARRGEPRDQEPSGQSATSPPELTTPAAFWKSSIRAVAYVLATVLVVGWLATGLSVVPVDCWGAYESFGRLSSEPLGPGLHFGWPVPFSRLRTVRVAGPTMVPIGLEGAWRVDDGTSVLWTRPHGVAEHPRLCGSTTELVVVNAVLAFQVRRTAVGFRDYCIRSREPERVLAAMAEEAISEAIGSMTLDELLAGDKIPFSDRLRQQLQQQADTARLGLDVTFLGLVSIHPPVEVSAAYLEVVNARTDAEREMQDARINTQTELVRVAMMADSSVADAQAAAAVRLTKVGDEATRISATANLFTRYPAAVRDWLMCVELGDLLSRRPLVLFDSDLPAGANIWIDGAAADSSSGKGTP